MTFDGSGSVDPDGAIVSYRFDFGDGSPPSTLSVPSAQHAYDRIGTFGVSVQVTDEFGASSAISGEITVGLVLDLAVNVSGSPRSLSQEASAAREPDGGLDVTWGETGAIQFARSDDGLSFTTPVPVVDPREWGTGNGFFSGQMRIAVAEGTIHVGWTVFDLFFGGAEVFYSRSTDRGRSFAPPLIVSTIDDSNSYVPGIAATGGGTVSLVWADATLLVGGSALSFSRSDDGGETFSPPIPLPSVGQGLCPVVLGSSHPLHVAWTEGPGEELRIHHARSDAAGAFGPPSVIDDGKGKSWCPLMARGASGQIYLVWEEGAAFADRRISFTVSDTQGDTFATQTTLSPTDRDVTCPSLATTSGGRIVIGWTEVNPTDFTLGHSFLVFSDDGGASFSPALRVRSPGTEAACAQILADDEGIDLVWSETAAGAPVADVLYARARILTP